MHFGSIHMFVSNSFLQNYYFDTVLFVDGFESDFRSPPSIVVSNFLFCSIVYGFHCVEQLKIEFIFDIYLDVLPNTRYEAHVYSLFGPLFTCTEVEI